jgi:hypothetical protein
MRKSSWSSKASEDSFKDSRSLSSKYSIYSKHK